MQTNRKKQNKAPLAYLAHASAGDPSRVPADAQAVAASALRNVPACPQGRRSIVRRPLRVQAQPRAVHGGGGGHGHVGVPHAGLNVLETGSVQLAACVSLVLFARGLRLS